MIKKELKKELSEVRLMMSIERPLKGYLGNKYYYWEKKYNELKKLINQNT